MKKFLVTGAAGFIGSHSVDHLLNQGHAVIGVDNLYSGHLSNLAAAGLSSRFEFVEGDLCDENWLTALFRDYEFDGVLHLAALVSVPKSFQEPTLNYRVNLAATDSLARLCVEYNCKRLIFASSAAVYGDAAVLPSRESDEPRPLSPYAAAKLASEIMLLGYSESYGLETVCFRYFNVYGARQDPGSPYSGVLSIFSERFRAGLPVTVYGDGEQTRDFVSVTDIACANCRALTIDKVVNGRYNVCAGYSISLNRVLTIYREAYPDAPVPRYAAARVGDIRHSLGDSSRMKHMLGIETLTPFEQGLRALIAVPEPLA